MRTVMLMRHAKSSWDNPDWTDFERPLNTRGRKNVPQMAAWLAKQSVQPDWCLCSTANRAQETGQGMKAVLSLPLESLESLYLACPRTILGILQKLPEEIQAPLVIAHNPGLEELTARWTGQDLHFPTATIAIFQFASLTEWRELSLQSQPARWTMMSPKALPESTAVD